MRKSESWRNIFHHTLGIGIFFRNPITCIEDLSNELFYEIFEYFPDWHLYDAFANLNSRFQHLIFHSPFLLKIQLDASVQSKIEHHCKNFYLPNKQKILSLYFDHKLVIDTFFAHCLIDSSFHRLQSISLNEVKLDVFLMLLFYFKSLPRLSSLDTILLMKQNDDLLITNIKIQ